MSEYLKGWMMDLDDGDVDYFPEDTHDYSDITACFSMDIDRGYYAFLLTWASVHEYDDVQGHKSAFVNTLFKDYLKPTEAELTMFELEFNLEYLPALKLMKEHLNNKTPTV